MDRTTIKFYSQIHFSWDVSFGCGNLSMSDVSTFLSQAMSSFINGSGPSRNSSSPYSTPVKHYLLPKLAIRYYELDINKNLQLVGLVKICLIAKILEEKMWMKATTGMFDDVFTG